MLRLVGTEELGPTRLPREPAGRAPHPGAQDSAAH
ncbi:hypothetical protein EES39_39150 [Streptomyces sp. ADI92-24]|nr:hypothetical protein EES39_39150 [Streptomyces sp. ADI92-24]